MYAYFIQVSMSIGYLQIQQTLVPDLCVVEVDIAGTGCHQIGAGIQSFFSISHDNLQIHRICSIRCEHQRVCCRENISALLGGNGNIIGDDIDIPLITIVGQGSVIPGKTDIEGSSLYSIEMYLSISVIFGQRSITAAGINPSSVGIDPVLSLNRNTISFR